MASGFLSGSKNFCKLFWVSCEVFVFARIRLDPSAPRLRIDDCFETRNSRLGPCGLLLSSHRSLQLEVRLRHCVYCTGPLYFWSFYRSRNFCEGGGDVVGVLTPLVGGVAQAFHDDRVVKLRVQLGEQEAERKDREEQVEVERESRVKEVRPWI